MLFLQKRKVRVAILTFNAFQTKMALLLTFLFCVLQGWCKLACVQKRLTSALLPFLKEISLTVPFKETRFFPPVVAIQIVIKPGKENALESLILSQSETRLLIFK